MFSKWAVERIFHSSSWLVFFAVVAVICSQVSQVIAFLLPLKVVLLLGSSTIPEYFPTFLLDAERDSLALALGVGSIIIFFIYIAFDFIGSRLIGLISNNLISESKYTCFNILHGKNFLASTKDFIVALSGYFFCFLVLFFLVFLDFYILFFVLSYLSLSVIGLVILAGSFSRLREYILDIPDRIFEIFGASGFFLAFLVILFEFLYLEKSSILWSIVALLLCRQMFSRLVLAIKSWRRFSIRGASAFPAQQQDSSTSGALINSAPTVPNMKYYFERANAEDVIRSSFRSIGLNDFCINSKLLFISSDELRVYCSPEEKSSWFLFRIVTGKSLNLAKKSYEISKIYKSSVFLDLVFQSEDKGSYAQLYKIPRNIEPLLDRSNIHLARRLAFRESCLKPPTEDLKLLLNKPSLVNRIQLNFWLDCRSRAEWLDDEYAENIDYLISSKHLLERLNKLPLCVHNPNNSPSNLFLVSGSLKFLDWGQCYLEPLGASWPYEFGYEELKNDFSSICSHRSELEDYSLQDVWLTSVLYHFERLCFKGHYLDAFKLLPELKFILCEFSN